MISISLETGIVLIVFAVLAIVVTCINDHIKDKKAAKADVDQEGDEKEPETVDQSIAPDATPVIWDPVHQTFIDTTEEITEPESDHDYEDIADAIPEVDSGQPELPTEIINEDHHIVLDEVPGSSEEMFEAHMQIKVGDTKTAAWPDMTMVSEPTKAEVVESPEATEKKQSDIDPIESDAL